MSEFSPGPWWAARWSPRQRTYHIQSADRANEVARVDLKSRGGWTNGKFIHAEEAKANARLIAAAPGLYAALEAVLELRPGARERAVAALEMAREQGIHGDSA